MYQVSDNSFVSITKKYTYCEAQRNICENFPILCSTLQEIRLCVEDCFAKIWRQAVCDVTEGHQVARLSCLCQSVSKDSITEVHSSHFLIFVSTECEMKKGHYMLSLGLLDIC